MPESTADVAAQRVTQARDMAARQVTQAADVAVRQVSQVRDVAARQMTQAQSLAAARRQSGRDGRRDSASGRRESSFDLSYLQAIADEAKRLEEAKGVRASGGADADEIVVTRVAEMYAAALCGFTSVCARTLIGSSAISRLLLICDKLHDHAMGKSRTVVKADSDESSSDASDKDKDSDADSSDASEDSLDPSVRARRSRELTALRVHTHCLSAVLWLASYGHPALKKPGDQSSTPGIPTTDMLARMRSSRGGGGVGRRGSTASDIGTGDQSNRRMSGLLTDEDMSSVRRRLSAAALKAADALRRSRSSTLSSLAASAIDVWLHLNSSFDAGRVCCTTSGALMSPFWPALPL